MTIERTLLASVEPGARPRLADEFFSSPLTRTVELFVSGTPYAGLSIVGQALSQATVALPGPIGVNGPNDAAGIFVHRALSAMHNEWLTAAGSSALGPPATPPAVEPQRLQEIVDAISADTGDAPSWAIIDPGLVHFSEAWRGLRPDARWIFVVRDPAQTAWVLLRRRAFADEPSPFRRVARALDVWCWYANAIVKFCKTHRSETALLFAPDDFGPDGDAQLATLTHRALATDLGRAWHPLLMRSKAPRWVRWQASLDSQVSSTLEALRAIRERQRADRGLKLAPSRRTSAGGAHRPVVCLVSRRRFAVSETFIRDHLRLLPASRWLVGGRDEVKRDSNDLPVGSMFGRGLASTMAEFGHIGTRIETRAVARYLRRHGVSAVLAEFGPIAVEYMDACIEARVPLVAHFHGYDAYKKSVLAEYGAAYRRLFDMAGALVVVSRDMQRQLESLGAPPDRIVWSPCGVDVNAFQGATPEHADQTFLSVGRFVEKKAPQNVLLAFRYAVERRPAARLVMVGDGPLLMPCRLLCDSLGLGDRVLFTGTLPPAGVVARMRSARAFVQHSMVDAEGNAEGTPVSVLEASSCSLPVVATRHMGIADVVMHNETGLLVEEGDVEGMGEQLVALCDDPALAGMLGRRARERVCAEFSSDRATERLWGAIDLAVRRPRSR